MNLKQIWTLSFVMLFCVVSRAQIYDTNNVTLTTFAGSAFSGYLDGVGQLTFWNGPTKITADSNTNLFVWDSVNFRIRKIAPDGTVTTFAGGGSASLPAVGTNASLTSLAAFSLTTLRSNVIMMVASGSVYFIQTNGLITRTNFPNSNGAGVCVDSSGNFYYPGGTKIYRLFTNGTWEVFVGSGNSGFIDGNGVFNSWTSPNYIACDSANNIWVYDSGRIRRINQNRDVTTPVFSGADSDGTTPHFNGIYSMNFDHQGNLLISQYYDIRKLTPTLSSVTEAGAFSTAGYTNGIGSFARFYGAQDACEIGGSIFVPDSNNERIRQISYNALPAAVTPANLTLALTPSLQINCIAGRTYQIQGSANLSAWTTLATIIPTSTPYTWLDQNPVAGNKYYRANLMP